MILTWILVIPVVGGLLAWIASQWNASLARWIALVACGAVLGIAIGIWAWHPATAPGSFFLDEKSPWIPAFGVSYHLAMDGLSLLLVALTGLLGIMAVGSTWTDIREHIGQFLLLTMLLLTGILGVFLAMDLMLFYLFWELMLAPMYFLIAIWGHENRIYAAIKFFLFTFISGVLMLAALIALYVIHGRSTGVYTFDYVTLLGTAVPVRFAMWLMLGFFVGFAVKLPTVPLHTWLPDAHTEAPTAGSVILAGLMLKTGAYGLMRFAIPLFPTVSVIIAPAAWILGVISIIYGAILTFAQGDFKRMVAYSSVSHMGFVLLGIYAGNRLAIQGAVMEIISHGVATGALFLIAGMIQERTHTRELRPPDGAGFQIPHHQIGPHRLWLGGLWATAPRMGGFTMLFALAALGLPGLGNFVGEFLVLIGAFQVNPVIGSVASLGFVFSVIYALRLVQASMLGPNENNWMLPDLSAREMTMLGVMTALIIWLGLYPQPIFNASKSSVHVVRQSLGHEFDERGTAR
jgi:NADH-quinone oxidoreductase subunit M